MGKLTGLPCTLLIFDHTDVCRVDGQLVDTFLFIRPCPRSAFFFYFFSTPSSYAVRRTPLGLQLSGRTDGETMRFVHLPASLPLLKMLGHCVHLPALLLFCTRASWQEEGRKHACLLYVLVLHTPYCTTRFYFIIACTSVEIVTCPFWVTQL